MNQKVPYLTRQIVYAFLVGLISGGVIIGMFDAYANQPLFSSACGPRAKACDPYSGGDGPSSPGGPEDNLRRYQSTQTCITVDNVTDCGPGN